MEQNLGKIGQSVVIKGELEAAEDLHRGTGRRQDLARTQRAHARRERAGHR